MYPLTFIPWLRTMVWGGAKIEAFKDLRAESPEEPGRIGESWEISAVPGHVSVVANGPWAGRTLTGLMQEHGPALVGRKVYDRTGDEFPLLIKFIDAKTDLSVQVHPDDALAARTHPGMKGKTEMWYVVGADPGASLLSGLTTAITPDEYEARVRSNTIMDVLAKHAIAPGDVFFLPAGRIHAIGAGSFVAEIQQTSDLTYRIYDYGRLGLDGKPRELHIEQAREAIDYRVCPDYRTEYSRRKNTETPLVRCPYFTTSLFDLDASVEQDLSGLDSFLAVMCVAGQGTLTDVEPDGAYTLPLRQGQTVLLPATAQKMVMTPAGAMTCLTSRIDA